MAWFQAEAVYWALRSGAGQGLSGAFPGVKGKEGVGIWLWASSALLWCLAGEGALLVGVLTRAEVGSEAVRRQRRCSGWGCCA